MTFLAPVCQETVQSATVAEGAYDFTIHNPGYVAKSAALAQGTGALVGVAMAALPEVAVVGAVVGVAGIALGAIGATSPGAQTYDAFKSAMPDLKIVYVADHHSSAEVKAAEQAVKAKTGEAVANVGSVFVARTQPLTIFWPRQSNFLEP